VAHYRLYFLDMADHIRRALDLECADDTEAMGVAKARQDSGPVELWNGARRVLRIEAREQSSAP